MENVFKYFEFSNFFKDASDSFSGNEIRVKPALVLALVLKNYNKSLLEHCIAITH